MAVRSCYIPMVLMYLGSRSWCFFSCPAMPLLALPYLFDFRSLHSTPPSQWKKSPTRHIKTIFQLQKSPSKTPIFQGFPQIFPTLPGVPGPPLELPGVRHDPRARRQRRAQWPGRGSADPAAQKRLWGSRHREARRRGDGSCWYYL